MESQPLVSVIVPCYNMESFISDTIKSVMGQTYPHWELLIVDDVSTDATCSIVEAFAKSENRIQLFTKKSHSGIASSRNQAISAARGQYLAFLDADDVWYPEKLQVQLQFMSDKNISFSFSSYDCIDEAGYRLDKSVLVRQNLDYEAYLRNTIIGCSTVMIDKDKVGNVVVPDYRTSEDTATWLDILKKGYVAYAIEQPLVSYRIRRQSASSNKLKASSDLWKVYRKHEKLPLLKAIRCFSCYAFNAIKKRL